MTVKVYLVSCSSMARSIVVVRSYYRVVTIYNDTPSALLSKLQWTEGVGKWMNIFPFMWFFIFQRGFCCCCCCFIMGSSENGLVTMLRTYQVSGNSEGFKTFCNGCKKKMARNVEGSHGVQSDKNVNKADLQSYIYQTSNREASSRSYCLDLTRFILSLLAQSRVEFIPWRFIARISLNRDFTPR